MLSLLTLLEFYQHSQTFFVIFSSYRFQMKQISSFEIRYVITLDNSTSWTKLCPKMGLGFEIQKTNVRIRIRILEISSVSIFKQNGQLWLFWSKFSRKLIFGWKFRKLMLQKESPSSRYHLYQFSSKNNNFDFFGPNLPKNVFWGGNFKNLSIDSQLAPPRYHVCQFSVKMDNFEFFSLNLEKLLNYVRNFGSNKVEGVIESWVEAEMNWVEVDGARWRWVHGLVIPDRLSEGLDICSRQFENICIFV